MAYFEVFQPLGETLDSMLRKSRRFGEKKLSIELVKKVAKDMLCALQFIHNDVKVVHSDIKPANIARSISQIAISKALDDVVKCTFNLHLFQMSFRIENSNLNDIQIRKTWRTCLKSYKKSQSYKDAKKQPAEMTFKLIDFGNVLVSLTHLRH